MKKRWAIFLISSAVLDGGIGFEPTARHVQLQPGAFVGAQATHAQTLHPQGRISGTGYLRAEVQLDATAPFPATVKEVLCKEGDVVAAGAVVARLESSELNDRLRVSEAAFASGRSDLRDRENRMAEAEKRLATTRELYRRDLIARREVAEAESAMHAASAEQDLAKSRFEQHRAALAHVRHLIGLSRIKAPISGLVTRRFVRPGDRVAVSAALVRIGSLTTLLAVVEFPALQTDRLQRGDPVEVSADVLPGKLFQGTITRVIERTPSQHNQVVEVRVRNPDGVLRPGAKVSVFLPEK